MELAQLHLLHRSAHYVQRQWERSAQESFYRRLNALLERHTELRDIAEQQQVLMSQLGLVEWSQGESGTQMGEKVALLSHNIMDVCRLIDVGGKYNRILEIFESWFAQVLQTQERRKFHQTAGEAGFDLIEGIGDGWKAESMVLERELTYYLRDLKAFGSVRPNSSLCRMQSLYSKLVSNMITEVDTVQGIENKIAIQEASWVESAIQDLTSIVNKDIRSIATA